MQGDVNDIVWDSAGAVKPDTENMELFVGRESPDGLWLAGNRPVGQWLTDGAVVARKIKSGP
jgi:hypothetical protein